LIIEQKEIDDGSHGTTARYLVFPDGTRRYLEIAACSSGHLPSTATKSLARRHLIE
jgi:hypothetical protein